MTDTDQHQPPPPAAEAELAPLRQQHRANMTALGDKLENDSPELADAMRDHLAAEIYANGHDWDRDMVDSLLADDLEVLNADDHLHRQHHLNHRHDPQGRVVA